MAEAIVIGVLTRTGSAVAIALGGSVHTPRFWARLEFGLITPGRPAQPYHAAAGMELSAASHLIGHVERDAEEAAASGLRAVADLLPAGAVRGIAVVVKDVSVPDRLSEVLRSHAWMHAAEGILYRGAVLAAAQACGWRAHAVELSSLPRAEHALAAVGQAAGRPWRRTEKDAARAAITVLAKTAAPQDVDDSLS
jgi:hypothetical protein